VLHLPRQTLIERVHENPLRLRPLKYPAWIKTPRATAGWQSQGEEVKVPASVLRRFVPGSRVVQRGLPDHGEEQEKASHLPGFILRSASTAKD
jgi:hypothetical protein